jgi:hypothetical protein
MPRQSLLYGIYRGWNLHLEFRRGEIYRYKKEKEKEKRPGEVGIPFHIFILLSPITMF